MFQNLQMPFENSFNNSSNHQRRSPFENNLNSHSYRPQTVRPNSSIDILVPSIKAISDSFKTLNSQFESLKQVNDSLCSFNEAFGAFLFGMVANDTTVQWKEPITKETIQRHNDHVERMNSLEATKAVHTQTVTAASTSKNHSTKVDSPHKRSQDLSHHGSSSKKRKVTVQEEKPLVSKRKFVSKVNIRKIIDRLPLEYREKTEPMRHMENVLKILKLHPIGLGIKDITTQTRMPQYIVTKCLNALTASKELLKLNHKDRYCTYQLDPAKYPSEER